VKTLEIDQATLDGCVNSARTERVILTRDGRPVALVVGIEGMDEEQIQLGASDKFWKLMRVRRKEKPISRAALERRIKSRTASRRRVK
jgi:antitoxin (DNA-binding transcriptional repressor) of toxin-antitoxin stability system